jgi:hypothetical protein
MLNKFKHARWLLLLFAFTGTIFSCQKRDVSIRKQAEVADSKARFPQTQEEKAIVDRIKAVKSILETIYKDPKVREEVSGLISSGFYTDEFVTLKDLLNPGTSKAYQTAKFKKMNIEAGVFEKRYKEEFDKRYTTNTAMKSGFDYFEENGITIYWPYSEEFSPSFQAYNFTIVAADRDADSGPGQIFAGYGGDGKPIYNTVTVDDDYAFVNPTQIVGIAEKIPEETGGDSLPPPPPTVTIDRVFNGYSRLAQNYDRLISFTGNGGGSEMKICRISGYLQVVNQQVTSFSGDVISKEYTRRDVKKKKFVNIYSVWDADWVVGNNEQSYAVYEEDNQGTKTFTGALSTTLKLDSTATAPTVTGSIGYSISVITQDDVITQRKIGRTAYFLTAKQDQGGGFNMCNSSCAGTSTADVCQDNTFLPAGQYWPLWDCGVNWKYLWPYKIYN